MNRTGKKHIKTALKAVGIVGAAMASFAGHFVCAICFIAYFCKKTTIKPRELLLPKKEDFSALNIRRRR